MSAVAGERRSWWRPRRLGWWIGALFSIGSVCFLVGPFPGFVELVGSAADGAVFFVGSIFFTSAALLQYLQAAGLHPLTVRARSLVWWACLIQLAGTIFFNVSTFQAMDTGLSPTEYDVLVWTPDLRGSICFLAAGALAYLDVRREWRDGPSRDWWVAAVNLAGCVAFMGSAIAAYVVPSTGTAIDLAAANAWTSLGALGFLIGAVLLLPPDPPSPSSATTTV